MLADELGLGPDDGGIGLYAFKDADTANLSVYDKYMMDNYVGMSDNYYEGRSLDWDEDLVWDTSEYPDEYYAEVMVDSGEAFLIRRRERYEDLIRGETIP